MRFLLKCIFWLGGVFLLMPGLTGKQSGAPSTPLIPAANNTNVSALQTSPIPPDLVDKWLQAGKTLQDISRFCAENPALCIAGKVLVQQAGAQAVDHVVTAYDGHVNKVSAKPEALTIPIPSQRP